MSVNRNDIDDALNLLWDMQGFADSILDNLQELSSMRDELVTNYEDVLEVGNYIEGIEREWEGYIDDIDNCASDIINAIDDLMGSIHDGLAALEEEGEEE